MNRPILLTSVGIGDGAESLGHVLEVIASHEVVVLRATLLSRVAWHSLE